jgi:photosystem II stability/assembly factor-like uncharacterized protein
MTSNGRPVRIYAGVNRFKLGMPPSPEIAAKQVRGVFRLVVGEDRWVALTNGLPAGCDVHTVTVHPHDPDTVLVGTDDGPYRSTDGGEHWERTDFPERGLNVWSILVHPTRPHIVYAGTAPIGMFRSDDGGAHWRRLPHPAVAERLKIPFPHRVMKLAINPQAPDEIFAVMEANGVMRSRDAGETWDDCNDGLVRFAEAPRFKSSGLCDQDFEGMLDGHSIAASAAAPGTVFVALRMGLFASPDEGTSWQDMELRHSAHLDYSRDIRVSPHDPRVLYVGVGVSVKNNNGAIYRSADLGRSWQRFDRAVELKSSIMSVALHATNPDHVYGICRFGQVIGTQDGGQSWKEYPLPEASGGGFSIACA